MMNLVQNWKERLQYYAHNWVIVVQSVVLKISLFFVYFFGIGFSYLLMPFFGRKLLTSFKVQKGSQESYWQDAKGYNNENLEQFNKQV